MKPAAILRMRKPSGGGGGVAGPTPVRAAVGTTNSTTNPTLPTVAYPTGISAGHYLELTVTASSTSGFAFDIPSGFSEAFQGTVSGVRLGIFYKFASGSESGSVAITGTGTYNGKAGGVMERYTGVNSSTPYEASANGSPNSASLVGNGITTLGDNRLVVNKYASAIQLNIAPGSGWSEAFDFNLGGAGPDMSLAGTDKEAASAGSVSAESGTHNAGSAQQFITFTYALIPA